MNKKFVSQIENMTCIIRLQWRLHNHWFACSQALTNNSFSNFRRSSIPDDGSNFEFTDELDAFSEISFIPNSSYNFMDSTPLPSFQETYSNVGFKVENDNFNCDVQLPIQQASQHPQSSNLPHCLPVRNDMPTDMFFSTPSCFPINEPTNNQRQSQPVYHTHSNLPYAANLRQTQAIFESPENVKIEQMKHSPTCIYDSIFANECGIMQNFDIKNRQNSAASAATQTYNSQT